MLKKYMAAGLISAGMLAGLASEALAAEVGMYGSTTVSGALVEPNAEAIEKQSGQLINISAVGSGRGLMALVTGSADIAMISAPLESVVAKLQSKGNGDIDTSDLTAHQMGTAKVAFVVHKDNPVKKLSFQQLADIMAGKIKNWKEVGGPDLAIEIFAESPGGGVRTMVEKELDKMGGQLANATDAVTSTIVARKVKRSPGALGITAQHMVTSKVHIIETDKVIEQPLILVTKSKPSDRVKKVLAAVQAIAKTM
jgi:phosphate transport system substrate-binding protein